MSKVQGVRMPDMGIRSFGTLWKPLLALFAFNNWKPLLTILFNFSLRILRVGVGGKVYLSCIFMKLETGEVLNVLSNKPFVLALYGMLYTFNIVLL